jgi:hypothetical protein
VIVKGMQEATEKSGFEVSISDDAKMMIGHLSEGCPFSPRICLLLICYRFGQSGLMCRTWSKERSASMEHCINSGRTNLLTCISTRLGQKIIAAF